MIPGLHADHVDASGAYSQKFAVVKELLETGVLKEIPKDFRDKETTTAEVVPITTSSSQIVGGTASVPAAEEEFDMTNGHADHYDETGRYAKAYEARFGTDSLTITEEQHEGAGNSWKSFLQKIIAEEKSKLKV